MTNGLAAALTAAAEPEALTALVMRRDLRPLPEVTVTFTDHAAAGVTMRAFRLRRL